MHASEYCSRQGDVCMQEGETGQVTAHRTAPEQADAAACPTLLCTHTQRVPRSATPTHVLVCPSQIVHNSFFTLQNRPAGRPPTADFRRHCVRVTDFRR